MPLQQHRKVMDALKQVSVTWIEVCWIVLRLRLSLTALQDWYNALLHNVDGEDSARWLANTSGAILPHSNDLSQHSFTALKSLQTVADSWLLMWQGQICRSQRAGCSPDTTTTSCLIS